jgi:glycine betaine/proline transport system substrate-binding protein
MFLLEIIMSEEIKPSEQSAPQVPPVTPQVEVAPPPVAPPGGSLPIQKESGGKNFSGLFLGLGLLIVVVLISAAGALFLSHKTQTPQKATVAQKPVIKLAVNPWKASELNANIAKVILEEKMGYKVQLVPVDEYKQWPLLAKGELHASLEVWPSGHKDDITKYIKSDKTVENGGALGPIGKIGWYIPRYLMNEHPELATWKGFIDPKNAALFAVAPGGKGQFYTGDPTWTQYDAEIIKNLGLPFEVQTLGSEDALIKKIDQTYAQKKPIVFYFWTPHWAHAVYDLVPVELPAYTDACYKDLKNGVNCDYPRDPLQKVFWSGFKDYAPDAYQFLRKFNYTNDDQIRMLAALELKKQSTAQVARDWVRNNEAVWQLWMQ